MLLDRRKVKFWQKIVFGFMAVLMAAFLVFGYSGVLNGCDFVNSAKDAEKEYNTAITKAQAATSASPKDPAAWTQLGEAYLSRSSIQTTGSDALTADLTNAAKAYAKASKLLAKKKGKTAKADRLEVLQSLATIYNQLGDTESAVKAYSDITEVTPKDAQAFFNLGSAAISAGDTDTALLAFNRFLELDPESADADAVKEWIKQNTP